MVSEPQQLFQGTLRSLVIDNPATGESQTRTTLQIGDASFPVYSEGQTANSCMTLANVRGYRVGGDILAASITNAGPLSSPACSAIGDQRTAVLLIESPTMKLPALITVPFVQGFMSGIASTTVDGYFREVSNGAVTVTPDVSGPYTLGADYGCVDNDTLVRAAMAVADGSVNFQLYSRIIVIAPRPNSGCSTRVATVSCQALSTPGDGALVASWGYIASDVLTTPEAGVSLAAKAIAYGMGIGTSYTRDYGTVTLGAFGPGGTDTPNGDHSIMGGFRTYNGVYPLGHIAAPLKVAVGWYISGTDFLNVQANSTNLVLPASSPTSGAKALRIRRGTGFNEWLWVEHRQFTGPYDSTLQAYSPTINTGVLVHHQRPGDDTSRSFLLHFNPVSAPNDFRLAMLTNGSTWNDPSSNLTLQVAAVSGGMQVTTTYRPTGGCVYTLSQSTINVGAATGSSGFTVTTGPYCEWTSTTSSPILAVTSPTFSTGSGSVTFNYAANATGSARSATIDVAGQTVTVNQSTGQAGSLQISGKTTLSGNALSGVKLTLSGTASQTTITDAAGDYVLTGLAAGSYTVTPTRTGYSFTPASTTFGSLASSQAANFAATQLPAVLSLDRTRLNYAARSAALLTPSQRVTVNFGGGSAAWTATANQPWLQITPAAGTGPTHVTVSVVPGLMPAGSTSATVTVSAPNATPTSQTVAVNFNRMGASGAPAGSFDTPTNNATQIAGSIAVTGWAIDDIYVTGVKIYRDKLGTEAVQPNGYVYIGDAVFVPNARPDVEALYTALPFQYQTGWGYLMLTNTVANYTGAPWGNGTIKLWAIATDIEGNTTNLGSKTITLDNAHSTKPFGAIDAPAPGATSSGSFLSNGWALTPPPNIISAVPTKIFVIVDGLEVGRVNYGQSRPDVQSIFAGYRNAALPGGNFTLDTALFANGIHAISWNVYDDAGNADGVGSRYFFIENGLSAGIASPAAPVAATELGITASRSARPRPQRGAVPRVMTAQELERLIIPLPDGHWTGAHVVNGEMQPLPAGSTLDNASGAFYWQLGPGFLGQHELLFTSDDGAVHGVTVNIEPMTFGERQ